MICRKSFLRVACARSARYEHVMRTSLFVSLSLIACVACGGAAPEPKAPATDSTTDAMPTSTESAAEKSVLTSTTAAEMKSAPVKTTAVSNTSDGSDIIPPFTGSSDTSAKPTSAKKPKPKGKSKKKPASN